VEANISRVEANPVMLPHNEDRPRTGPRRGDETVDVHKLSLNSRGTVRCAISGNTRHRRELLAFPPKKVNGALEDPHLGPGQAWRQLIEVNNECSHWAFVLLSLNSWVSFLHAFQRIYESRSTQLEHLQEPVSSRQCGLAPLVWALDGSCRPTEVKRGQDVELREEAPRYGVVYPA